MVNSQNSLGLVFFPAFDWSISPTHPEREERLLYTRDQVVEEGLFDIEGIKEFNPIVATEKDIRRVHICVPDVNNRITKSHLISAGGAIKAGESVMNNKTDKAFAIVRPPGHHARRIVHGSRGFCTINIESVMLEYLRNKYNLKKVAIVDTDCHHGDGTQDVYRNDPNTLFISLHQDGRTLYPGSGFIKENGGPAAKGYTLNIPLPPGTSDDGYLYTIKNLVLPIINEYKPDLIINSAGQDNHFSDPLTNMNISANGYAKLNELLDPDIAVLEGGYSIEDALPYINTAIILAMAGLDYSGIKEPEYNPDKLQNNNLEQIKEICVKVQKEWENRNIDYKNNIREDRNVFYDTDNIREKQKEITYTCKNCFGFSEVISSVDNGFDIKAYLLSRNICKKCRRKAYEFFEQEEIKNDSIIYLQDKDNDIFKTRN